MDVRPKETQTSGTTADMLMGATLAECQAACEAVAGCYGFDRGVKEWHTEVPPGDKKATCYLKGKPTGGVVDGTRNWVFWYRTDKGADAQAPCQPFSTCFISGCKRYDETAAASGTCKCKSCLRAADPNCETVNGCTCTKCKGGYSRSASSAACKLDFNLISPSSASAGFKAAFKGECSAAATSAAECKWGGCYPNTWDSARRLKKCGGTLGDGEQAASPRLVPSCPDDSCVTIGFESGLTGFGGDGAPGTVDIKCASPAEMNGHGLRFNGGRTGPAKNTDGSGGLVNSFHYGVSSYIRLLRPLDKREGGKQFGYWGQWIQPKPGPKGGSIEGGMFQADKVGLSYWPKYHAGSSVGKYNPNSDTAAGWGFYERRLSCKYLGMVLMSNTFVLPPNGIPFEATQDQHEADGGIFVGASWVALPLFGGKARTRAADTGFSDNSSTMGTSDGKLSWTFVMDTANVKGPLLTYPPEFFYRSSVLDSYNANKQPADQIEARHTLGYSPAFGLSFGGEFHDLPVVSVSYTDGGQELDEYRPFRDKSLAGPLFWKVPALSYPNYNEMEPLVLDVRSYSEETYNAWVSLFAADDANDAAADAAFAAFDPAFVGGYKTANAATEQSLLYGVRLSIPDNEPGTKLDADGARCRAGKQNFEKDKPFYNCGPKHLSEMKMDQTLLKLRGRIVSCTCEKGACKVTTKTAGLPDETRDVGTSCEGHGSAADRSETNLWLHWKDGAGSKGSATFEAKYGADGKKDQGRTWGRYWKTTKDATSVDGTTKGYRATRVSDVSEVPAALVQNEYASSLKGPAEYQAQAKADDRAEELLKSDDQFCYACKGKDVDFCDTSIHKLQREDGGVTYYRWYRWSEQPAWRQLRKEFPTVYTDVYMAKLQRKVEAMHKQWKVTGDWSSKSGKQWIPRPKSVPKVAEVERVLIVDPKAAGVPEFGWIPVSIGHSYPDFGGTDPSKSPPKAGTFDFTYDSGRAF